MSNVDTVNQSLYFTAASAAASAAGRMNSQQVKKDKKTAVTKKTSFRSVLQESMEKEDLISSGMPVELLSMTQEEAVVYLKDAVDVAGDELTEKMTPEAFMNYRTAIRQFMTFVEKNCFTVDKTKRFGRNRNGKPRDPAIQIHVINTKLDSLASDLLYNHMDKLKLLAKVDEINGLLVDLMAA